MHETCIPEGTYNIKFRKEGGFHQKYSERYKNAHYGMLELQDVPGFKYILIHSGNTDEHTSGCILTGNTQQDLDLGKDGMIGQSRIAYQNMYAKVAKVLLQGKPVTLEVSKINLDGAAAPEQSSDSKTLDSIHEKVTRIDAKLRGRPII